MNATPKYPFIHRQKIAFLFFASFILLGFFIVVVLISRSSTQHVDDTLKLDYEKRIEFLASQTGANLKYQTEALRDKLSYIGQVEAIQSLDSKACNTKIKSIYDQLGSSLGNLGRIGPDGKFYCSVNQALIGTEGSKLGSYVTDIFNDPNHTPVMSRMIKPTGSASYLIAVHVPVYDNNHQFQGTLGGALSMDKLRTDVLSQTKPSDNGFMTLLDDNGQIMSHPKTEFISKDIFSPELEAFYSNNADVIAAIKDATNGRIRSVEYTVSGERRFATYVPVEIFPGRRWVVSGVVPVKDIQSLTDRLELRRTRATIAALFALVLVVFAVTMTWYLSRRVFGPIAAMADAADDISEGKTETKVPAKGSLEIITLATAINKMVSKLRHYSTNLETQVDTKTKALAQEVEESKKHNKQLETARKAAQQAKEEADAERVKDEAILQSVGEGLIVIDENGIITQVNPAAEALLDQTAKELKGKWYPKAVTLMDAHSVPLETTARPEMETILTGTAVNTNEYYLQLKGSGKLPVAVTASPYLIDDHPMGVIIVLRDITKERELDQAKDDFIALASHQLRTPATAIKQFVGMLVEGYAGELTSEQKDLLQQAYLSNERQIHITQDMLNVAGLESGTLELRPEDIDVSELVKTAAEEQSFVITNRQQKLTIDTKDNMMIFADRNLLRMLVDNFISNASKYTPEGGTITVTTHKKDGGLELSIADTGVGISKKDQKLLFNRFSRIKNNLSTKVGGSGLGLYIARKIVDLHGGKISVTSKEGKGTTFAIWLPAKAGTNKKA